MTHIRNQLHHHDPAFVDRFVPYFKYLEKYFRYRVIGLERIPVKKASLVVMNHGIVSYHGFLLALRCVEDLKLYPRGLGAGFLFDIPGVREFFLYGGAVNANPKNAKQLLKEGHCVMLAPGGLYESLIASPDLNRIPWERRTGFVRMACEANVPIIPTYCPTIDKVYWNSKFLLKKRIKFLERTRLPFPLFMGLGLIPFPFQLIHYIGKSISCRTRKGETLKNRIKRVHSKVLSEMWRLSKNHI